MRVPGTPAQAQPGAEPPSDTMLMMAAAVMHQQGKFAALQQSTEDKPQPPSQNELNRRGIEIRRELEDMGLQKTDPRGEPLNPRNEWVPGNRGLYGRWNRRT